MITVSKGWEAVRNKTLLPEMFIEITCAVTEPGLQEAASIAASSPTDFSNVDQVISKITKNSEKYSTLDYGCWGLDGSFSYFDGTPEDPGYVNTDYSTSDGSMTTYPTITINFPERRSESLPGIQIEWSKSFGGWAVDFRVTARNGTGIVAQTTVIGNTSPTSEVWLDMVDYSTITIEILKWSHPYQRKQLHSFFLLP